MEEEQVSIASTALTSLQVLNPELEVSQNGGTPSSRPFLDGIFPDINHAFGDTPIYGSPQFSIVRCVLLSGLLWAGGSQGGSVIDGSTV